MICYSSWYRKKTDVWCMIHFKLLPERKCPYSLFSCDKDTSFNSGTRHFTFGYQQWMLYMRTKGSCLLSLSFLLCWKCQEDTKEDRRLTRPVNFVADLQFTHLYRIAMYLSGKLWPMRYCLCIVKWETVAQFDLINLSADNMSRNLESLST